MRTEHFSLLKVKPGSPLHFSGPIARVFGSHLKDNKLVKAIAAAGTLKGGREIELLGMKTVIAEDGMFSASPTGPMGKLPQAKEAVEGVQNAIRNRGKPLMMRNGTLVYTSYQPPVPTNASMKLLGSRLSLEMDGHPQPTVCTLQVTTRCQANCIHCSAARFKRQHEPEMTTQDWKRIVRESEQLGAVTIIFTGGEPLLRPDIFELIDWVDKSEAVVGIFSNGLLLSEENIKRLVDAGLWFIHVSIDSPNASQHDEMRRVPGCFDKAIEGLTRAKEAGILTGISTYATPERLRNGQVVELIEMTKKYGFDEITIFDVVPTGRLLHEDRKHLLTDEDKAELCRIENKYNEGHPLPQVITQAHVNGPTGIGCYAGWCQFYMTAYGEVTPCDFTPLAFGNARDESIETIWKRMISHDGYCNHKNSCRMQDPDFRSKWIDKIPFDGPFPYPVEKFTQLADIDPDSEIEYETAQEYSSLGIKG
ncbi:radical SAM protein [bacterium]|nr:radical SAM protein [bacterium]